MDKNNRTVVLDNQPDIFGMIEIVEYHEAIQAKREQDIILRPLALLRISFQCLHNDYPEIMC
jgi:ribosomal protein L30/L7E